MDCGCYALQVAKMLQSPFTKLEVLAIQHDEYDATRPKSSDFAATSLTHLPVIDRKERIHDLMKRL